MKNCDSMIDEFMIELKKIWSKNDNVKYNFWMIVLCNQNIVRIIRSNILLATFLQGKSGWIVAMRFINWNV